MRAISISSFRKNLAAALDRVNDDHVPVIITRSGGRPSAVLMSLEDFAAWDETCHLLESPANAARLRDSAAELAAGR
jgi:antitoxin YefM